MFFRESLLNFPGHQGISLGKNDTNKVKTEEKNASYFVTFAD